MHLDFPPASFDILAKSRFLLEGTLSFITGLDYLNWKTYVFLYLALTLGAGAAPSKTWLSAAISVAMIPLLAVTVIVGMLKLTRVDINLTS